jgi:hypothetical protein
LAVLDLARPYAGPSLRPWQWLAGVITLAVLWAWLRGRRSGREALPYVALAAFLLPTYVDHSRNLESDGIHYYTYLRSLLFDRDLDLANDYALLGSSYRGPNVLPVGAPILWSPLVVTVHVLRQGARLFGLPAPTGVEPIYQAAACLATLAYGAAGLFVLMGVLRQWVGPAPAFWATVIAWVGSPLRFYLSVLPGLAHGGEFFAAALVLAAYQRLRLRPGRREAALAGAGCGLVFLLRSQDALLLALPVLYLTAGLVTGPRRDRRLRALLATCGAFLLAALPQLAVWQAMFGRPVLVPHQQIHGVAFMHLDEPQLRGTLVSPRGGLFTSHPAMLLAVLGLFAAARRHPRYVATVTPVLLAMWYVNSTVFDWYHVRRFTGVVPLLAPGLAFALGPLARAGPAAMAVVAFLFLRYDLAVDTLRAQPGDPVPVRAALSEMKDGLARDTYVLLERVSPRAAVAVMAVYTREPVLRESVTRIDLAADSPVLRVPLRARNLSAPAVEDGEPGRWVRDTEARFFLPVSSPAEATLTVRARALETKEPQSMEAFWNERPLGRQPMTSAWADYRFLVPADAVRAGTNVLVLRFERAPIYRRMRGEGPREVRPAALASLTLHRTP